MESKAADGNGGSAAVYDAALANLPQRLRDLPSDSVLVEYAWLEDRLLVWTVHGGRLDLTIRTLPRHDLVELTPAVTAPASVARHEL